MTRNSTNAAASADNFLYSQIEKFLVVKLCKRQTQDGDNREEMSSIKLGKQVMTTFCFEKLEIAKWKSFVLQKSYNFMAIVFFLALNIWNLLVINSNAQSCFTKENLKKLCAPQPTKNNLYDITRLFQFQRLLLAAKPRVVKFRIVERSTLRYFTCFFTFRP